MVSVQSFKQKMVASEERRIYEVCYENGLTWLTTVTALYGKAVDSFKNRKDIQLIQRAVEGRLSGRLSGRFVPGLSSLGEAGAY